MIYENELDHTNFLNGEEGDAIVAAIARAEDVTSGEIRVHLEDHCNGDPFARAREVFELLEMNRTVQRNGVLIYIAVKDHLFAIFGDDGINEKVGQNYWEDILGGLASAFKGRKYASGLIEAIKNVGGQLAAFFPDHPADLNELTDSISLGKDLKNKGE